MDEAQPKPDSWLAVLRRATDSSLGLVQSRVELFAVEWQEEKCRLLGVLVWLGVVLTLITAGLLIGMAALALFLWEHAGYAGLVGLGLVTLGVAFLILWVLRRRLLSSPPPFGETMAEFRKDRECLRPKN